MHKDLTIDPESILDMKSKHTSGMSNLDLLLALSPQRLLELHAMAHNKELTEKKINIKVAEWATPKMVVEGPARIPRKGNKAVHEKTVIEEKNVERQMTTELIQLRGDVEKLRLLSEESGRRERQLLEERDYLADNSERMAAELSASYARERQLLEERDYLAGNSERMAAPRSGESYPPGGNYQRRASHGGRGHHDSREPRATAATLAAPANTVGRINAPCKFFRSGTCRNGNQCRFTHERP